MSLDFFIQICGCLTVGVVIVSIIMCVRNMMQNEIARDEANRLLSEVETEREGKKDEFRKIYNISEETPIFRKGEFYATSPINPTEHEMRIASDVVYANYFKNYFVFVDYYFKTDRGAIVQIDVLAVSKRGIFVFESKDYTGWIYGDGNQNNWTKTSYNRKYHFYNPIRQNANHVAKLRGILGNRPRFHSIVVFGDKAVLKEINCVPKNTYIVSHKKLLSAIGDIMEKWPEQFTTAEVLAICKTLNRNRLYCNNELAEEHVEAIKEDVTGKKRVYK